MKKTEKINYIGKKKKPDFNDHQLKGSFELKSSPPYFLAICPECSNTTKFPLKDIKVGLNKFSISCSHCGGWNNIQIDFRAN